MQRRAAAMFGLLVISGMVGAACSARSNSAAAPQRGTVPAASSGGGIAGPAPFAPDASGKGTSGNGDQVLSLGGLNAPEIGAKIIKTASINLEVKDSTFSQRFQDATSLAAREGGYVSSSNTSSGKHPYGQIVLRVPASVFEATLGALRQLGSVKGEQLGGSDVTGRVVDLQARLTNWQSQEAVLLGLMRRAATIQDSIRVQQSLSDVQLQIEELKGELNALNDQADLSTITVGISEAGAVPVKKPSNKPSLASSWSQAWHGSIAVVGAVVVGLGYVLPLAIMAGLAFALYRRIARPKPVTGIAAPASPAA
jgi:hypothetical protein